MPLFEAFFFCIPDSVEIFLLKKNVSLQFQKTNIMKSYLLLLLGCIILATGCQSKAENPENETTSIVYFTKDISPKGVMEIFSYVEKNVKGNVGIKVHFGEDGNQYFVPANMVAPLCKKSNGTLIETNVAYTGRRNRTQTHI